MKNQIYKETGIKSTNNKSIQVINAKQNNLKNISVEIPRNKITVITGLSGSGKSSLAFDTIYAEGQRRFVESLSAYTRQFLERMDKPDVEYISGLPPAVAIQQKSPTRNPRSTVGTTTEIYDYLRILYARIGETICYNCGKKVDKNSPQDIVNKLISLGDGTKVYILFPVSPQTKSLKNELQRLRELGFFRAVKMDSNEIIDFETQDIQSNLLNEELYILSDRLIVKKGDEDFISRATDSVETAFGMGDGRVIVRDLENNKNYKFSFVYECSDCAIVYQEPSPQLFSFNSPLGACPHCQGFGRTIGWDEDLVVPDKSKSINDGAFQPLRTDAMINYQIELVRNVKKMGLSVDLPYLMYSDEEKKIIWEGKGRIKGFNLFTDFVDRSSAKIQYRILANRYRGYTACKECGSSRLRTSARQVFIHKTNLPKLIVMPIDEVLKFFMKLKLTSYEQKIAKQVVEEITRRLSLLVQIGLGYLSLTRLTQTLSGGELQRISLATALGTSLVGTLFVLDEPSIGLHPQDTQKLIDILKKMRDIGNTILVVEHDLDIINSADKILEIGPKSGEFGGEIVFAGSKEELIHCENSITSEYINLRKQVEVKHPHKPGRSKICVYNPRENNLKMNLIEFPLNCITVVTGVSGSGKSTLVFDILYSGIKKLRGEPDGKNSKFEKITGFESIENIEIVDQSPIGRSSRSTPATYTKTFDAIRDLFASTQLSKQFGLKPGYFSFNVTGGRCEQCDGEGYVTVDMQFLADVRLKCEACNGTRYKPDTLHFTFNNKSIVDVLNMTVDEAYVFFEDYSIVTRRLNVLREVGLGYLRLGQPSTVLSGGEAQRLKIAEFLDTKNNTNNLYIFDEPTTGLHLDDISKLIKSFERLVQEGNSVIIVEHNLEIIKNADWIIELGPEAGVKGGELLFTGSPKEILNTDCPTGRSLKNYSHNFEV
ncbi:MAG: excinuclease ABC subunit A [Ignavibacteria bacterium GWF2_33_9]|nr:MAG: excinuclease ABC subunit A [Ignavibacteria bacterium GWF2_33_9]